MMLLVQQTWRRTDAIDFEVCEDLSSPFAQTASGRCKFSEQFILGHA